jgi:Tfp pilus assembly protein PilX
MSRKRLPAHVPPAEGHVIARRSRQRGVALVLVMWIAVILGVVAASFIMERHTETMVVMNSV